MVNIMREKTSVTKKMIFYIASFAIPAAIILVALAGLHVVPFGDKTLIIADANGLYINSLSYAGRMFRGIEGIIYSFEKGLGGNMMAYVGGTMLNPFYLFFTFFDILDYPLAYSLVCVCNLAFCGTTMYIFLKDFYGHNASNLIFSTTYALIGFNVAYAWQVIFFTGVQTLPLMVLGLRRIFQKKNPWLYIISLAYSLVTDFYFGYTLCIVSVLIFFAVLWQEKDNIESKLSLFINYAVSSVCGGLLPVVVWLPAFLSLRGGRLDQTGLSDFSFAENMPFLEIGSKLFTGANTTNELINGLPNIFVGLLPIALVVLYFMNSQVDNRKKTVAGILLGFYLLNFYIIAFNMLMHGGTTTNWFNYRYSFIFSFLLILVAAYEWKYVLEESRLHLKRCLVIMVIATVLIFSKKYSFVIAGAILLDYCILLIMALALRMHHKDPIKNPAKTVTSIVLVLTCFSMFGNFILCTHNLLKDEGWSQKVSDYHKTVSKVNPLIVGVKLGDHDFYRMEVNEQRSGNCGNDPFFYGYNGIGHGGSHERDFVRTSLYKLGVHWYGMRNYYAEGTPAATDALLGVRYLVADEDMVEEKEYTRLTDMEKMGLSTDEENYDLYQSMYALPIAFMSQTEVNRLELSYDDIFDNLNRVWKSISGTEKLAFVEEDDIEFTSINMIDTRTLSAGEARDILKEYEVENGTSNHLGESESESSASESTSKQGLVVSAIMDEAPQFYSSVEFSFKAKQDGPVYVYHRAGMSEVSGAADPILKYMGYHHKGDIVKGYLLVQGDYVDKVVFEEFSGRFRVAYADLQALQDMSETVRKQPTTIEKVKESHLTGTMTAKENQELLFTIPWDEGWTCYVDGQKTPIKQVLGVFMAVDVAAGQHTFEMRYEPTGLHIGVIISIATVIITVLYLLLGCRLIDRISGKMKEIEALPVDHVDTEKALTGELEVTTNDQL